MDITQIDITNFQGLHHVALPVIEPVLLVSGLNGAGKSSLLDAIAMAITGQPRRVTLKRDIPRLITEGYKKGSVNVHTSEGLLGTQLPPTKTAAHLPVDNFLPFSLDSSAFAQLNDKDRRKLLFELTGASARPQVIAEKMAARGISKEMVEKVKPLLLSGFAAASDHAKEMSSEARGAWMQVTGERYGAAKAEGWIPEDDGPTVDPEQLKKAKVDLKSLDAELEESISTLGLRKSEGAQAKRQLDEQEGLKATAELLERRSTKLERDKAELEKWEDQVNKAKEAGGAKKEGLIHDMASALSDVIAIYPDCKDKIDHPLARYVAEHGPVNGSEGDPELAKRLPEFEGYVNKLSSAVSNSKRDLDASQAAVTALESMAGSASALPAEAIDIAESNVNNLRQLRDKAKAAVTLMQDAVVAVGARKEAAESAAKQHQEAQLWSEISDALSPTGIPAEILNTALSPINDLMRELSQAAGWRDARITGDIEITYRERAYGQLSESEKWRADMLLSIAIASMSGQKFVTIDRFDVLEPASRPQALKLLLYCAAKGHLKNSIIAGTMRQPMPRVPKGIQQVWIEEGVIVEQESAA